MLATLEDTQSVLMPEFYLISIYRQMNGYVIPTMGHGYGYVDLHGTSSMQSQTLYLNEWISTFILQVESLNTKGIDDC